MILSDQQAVQIIRAHKQVPSYVVKGRTMAKDLFCLIEGDDFKEHLIKGIEHIEGTEKAKARIKYSRSIKDFYERLLMPITNVFNSTGGSKKYKIENQKAQMEFLKRISRIRDGKSIQDFVENKWMPLYHNDPNGVIFMEYKTKDNEVVTWPTYKGINTIRAYRPKGQLVEWILFEPIEINDDRIWRLVDDVEDRFILERGEDLIVIRQPAGDEEGDGLIHGVVTFEHPFGEVPALINSNIIKVNEDIRLSPVNRIVELSKEYARDQSIKTIYKFLHGFPIFWRYVTQCKTCTGTGKKGVGVSCGDCDGKGFQQRKDVTDSVNLSMPKKDDNVLAPNIAGYISPDLETWATYDGELKLLEITAQNTHWGTHVESSSNETATGRFIDVQPVINRLNKYADVAEWVEKKITEWSANVYLPQKDKDESIASIAYGRRYIIESPDVILIRYEEEKKNGANSVILDRLLNEYITAKYKNDPEWLGIELKKLAIEPYVHLTIEQVDSIYGNEEAQKKGLFNQWWISLEPKSIEKSVDKLKADYDAWFIKETEKDDNLDADSVAKRKAQAALRGSVGGVQGIVSMSASLASNMITEEAIKEILIELYGLKEVTAGKIAKKSTINKKQE